MRDYNASHRDSKGFTARPMTQAEWDAYADAWNGAKHREECRDQACCALCTCGCSSLEDDCTTPIPEGPARDLTPEEAERESLGEWYRTRMDEPMSPEEEEALL